MVPTVLGYDGRVQLLHEEDALAVLERATRLQLAEDPMLVFNLADQIRETIQQTLYSLLMQRRTVFF